MTTPLTHQVIYDTDPGVDDAMALYFALAHPAIEVVGITTTFGNVTVEQAAHNALYLTEIAGRNIPVTRGVATPWCKPSEAPPAHIHGADGLGNLPHRIATSRQLDPRSSAQFIASRTDSRVLNSSTRSSCSVLTASTITSTRPSGTLVSRWVSKPRWSCSSLM